MSKIFSLPFFLFVAFIQFSGCKLGGREANTDTAGLLDETSESEVQAIIDLGVINVINRDSPFVLTAPHGKYDGRTGEIVEKVCETLMWDCVVSRGYRTTRHPFNVNRPTEGIGLPSTEEIHTPDAATVYAHYKKSIDQANPIASRKILVEVHGNSRPGSIHNIEIALVNVDEIVARKLKKVFEDKLAVHNIAIPNATGQPTIKILMEGLDQMTFLAGGVKRFGILGAVKSAGQKALHFEFPKILRADYEAHVSAYLADILKVSEALLGE